jgi:calcineurin-like phosphoesterase family protein
MIYFTSDLHFGHENIIKFCKRPYANAEEMNAALIKNINDTVGADDELYILGDFAFLPTQKIKPILDQFVCKNLHYVHGNHDKAMFASDVVKYFKSFGSYNRVTWDKGMAVLFHYPILDWESAHRGAWMLHGHCHNTMQYPDMLKNKKILDVGVDVWNYKPVSIEQVREYMKDRENIVYGYMKGEKHEHHPRTD